MRQSALPRYVVSSRLEPGDIAMSLGPQIEGTVTIRTSAGDFLEAFRRRVVAGPLSGQPHFRSNHVVREAGSGTLRVHAADRWTAFNVGLNELELRPSKAGTVQYRVRYWRWARFALVLSGGLGGIGLALLLGFDVRGYIASHPSSQLQGLSVDQNLLIAWAMVLFWGFVWPWILIAMHNRPLHRLVARLIAEVDAQAAGAASP